MNQETLLLLRDFSSLFVELIAAIIGSVFYFKYKRSLLKYFLIYLWFIVGIEYLAFIMREYRIVDYNAWLFNTFYGLSFTFLLKLYHSVLYNSTKKKIVLYFIVTYIILFVINSFYENYITQHQIIHFIGGSCFLVIAIIFYFIQILGSEKVLSIKKNLLFWISIGLLILYIGYIPFRLTINYYADIDSYSPLFSILYLLILICNLFFITGFIWADKKQLY